MAHPSLARPPVPVGSRHDSGHRSISASCVSALSRPSDRGALGAAGVTSCAPCRGSRTIGIEDMVGATKCGGFRSLHPWPECQRQCCADALWPRRCSGRPRQVLYTDGYAKPRRGRGGAGVSADGVQMRDAAGAHARGMPANAACDAMPPALPLRIWWVPPSAGAFGLCTLGRNARPRRSRGNASANAAPMRRGRGDAGRMRSPGAL